MAERRDLRRHAALFGEGIVGGDAAVGVQADHLAQIFGHVLRRVELLPFARGDEQILAIWRKGEAVREMAAAGHFRVLLPDDLQSLDSRRVALDRSEEHTSELQSLMRISYAAFCLKKKTVNKNYQSSFTN